MQGDCSLRRNAAALIPERAVVLKLHVCIEKYSRSAGHRAYEAGLCAKKDYVAWTTMAKDVIVFVQNCFHCVATIPKDKVQRPLDKQLKLHATKPNKNLHFRLFLRLVFKRWEIAVHITSQRCSERLSMAFAVSYR
jgi:hypothetical protein